LDRRAAWAGVIACLFLCAACAQMALLPISPIISALASLPDPDTAEEIVAMEKKRDWPGLVRYAQAKLQVEPRKSDWWFLQGYALARQSRHTEAIAAYQQALKISPEDEGSWLYLGYSQRESGQSELAIRTFSQALRYRPESAITYLALADTYARQNQFDRAIPGYRESVRYDSRLLEGWYGLAVACHSTGQRDCRDEALKSVQKIDPRASAEFERLYLK
jgi:tetratricopeptide (TPR) repeat protein